MSSIGVRCVSSSLGTIPYAMGLVMLVYAYVLLADALSGPRKNAPAHDRVIGFFFRMIICKRGEIGVRRRHKAQSTD